MYYLAYYSQYFVKNKNNLWVIHVNIVASILIHFLKM